MADARPIMEAMILASRNEPGCLGYGYAQDVLDPGLIHVHEVWRDLAALEAHCETPHIKEWRSHWPALGLTERRLQWHEMGASHPA